MSEDPIAVKRQELIESVEREETELKLAVDELSNAAQARVHLGERIAERPWLWLAGAFAVGLWVGAGRRA